MMESDKSVKSSIRKKAIKEKKRFSMNIENLIPENKLKHQQSDCNVAYKKMNSTTKFGQLKSLYGSVRDPEKRISIEFDETVPNKRWSSIAEGLEQEDYNTHDKLKNNFIENMQQENHNTDMSKFKLVFYDQTMRYLFLDFLLRNLIPSEFLFGLLVEFFRKVRLKKNRMGKDMEIFAYQISSLFLCEHSPLQLPNLSEFSESVMKAIATAESETDIRSAFDSAFEKNLKTLSDQFLAFLNEKSKIKDKYLAKGSQINILTSQEDFHIVVGAHLKKIGKNYKLPYKLDSQYTRENGIVVALQLLFYLEGFKIPCIYLPEVYFLDKKLKMKTLKKRSNTLKNAHSFNETLISRPNICGICNKIIWGTLPQAMECSNCLTMVHTFCSQNSTETCLKRKESSISLKMNLKSRNMKLNTITEKRTDSQSYISGDSINLHEDVTTFDFLEDPDLNYLSDLPSLESVYGADQCKALSPNNRKFHQVMNEFIHTERTHLRILKTLSFFFHKPMTETFPEIAETIFPSLSELIEYHSLLVTSFNERGLIKQVTNNFADYLLPLFNDSVVDGFFKACCDFCSNQKNIIEVYKETVKTNPEFANFVTEGEKTKFCMNLKLKDLLIAQMQRLTKYPLFIDQLIKYSKDNSELEKLEVIKKYLIVCLKKVNENAAMMDNYNYLVKVASLVEVKQEGNVIPSPYDTFDVLGIPLIHKGDVGVKVNKKVNECVLLLFQTDLVILFKSDTSRYVLRSFMDKATNVVKDERISPVFPLSEHVVIRLLAADKKCFLVLHSKEYKLVTFYTNSNSAAKTWVNFLNKSIEDIKNSKNSQIVNLQDKVPSADLDTNKTIEPEVDPIVEIQEEIKEVNPRKDISNSRRLRKIRSLHERTSIMVAQKSSADPLLDLVIGKLNSVFSDIESNENNSVPSPYIYLSETQLPNLHKMVQALEDMKSTQEKKESIVQSQKTSFCDTLNEKDNDIFPFNLPPEDLSDVSNSVKSSSEIDVLDLSESENVVEDNNDQSGNEITNFNDTLKQEIVLSESSVALESILRSDDENII